MNGDSMSAKVHQARKSGLRWQYGIAAGVLIAGLLLSCIAFFLQRQEEYGHIYKDFERAAQDRIMALKKVVEIDLLSLKTVGSFYDGSNEVDRNEFTTFVTPLINNNFSISSMQWAPRVKNSQRAAFETGARANGLPDFKIVEAGKGALAEASSREEYFPLFYIEPHKNRTLLLGFDLGTIPACLKAMRESCDTGQFASTGQIILPGESRRHPNLVVFLPIYNHKVSNDTVEDRRKNLQGFIVCELLISGTIEESFETMMPTGIDIYFFDREVPSKAAMLHYHPSRLRNRSYYPVDPRVEIGLAKMSLIDTLDIVGQRWTIACIPSPEFIAARTTWHPWVVGIGCMLLTGLLAAYLLTIAVRNARTAELAAQLAGTNQQLNCEIADRKCAEEASKRETAKLSAMISAMEEGVVFADVDNTIIEINNYLCNFVGKTREEILGKRIEEIHQGDSLERILSQIDKLRKGGVSCPLVLQRSIAGKELIFRMQPIYRDGQYDGVLLNVIDVSELVRARQQAEVANKAKSSFLANMSHEMRTPLSAILGYNDLLMDPKIDCSNKYNYLMVVRRNGENLLHLINDILDLSKIEAGKLTLNMQPCNLVAMLSDVAGTMRPRAEQRGNILTVEYLSELPESICTDTFRLRQAIVNLAGNAVKFTENGQVRIKVSFLRQWRGGKPAVKIDVADTGIGIREDVVPRLFQPFDQGDAATSQKYGGTGLGLAISYHIAELLGGELSVKSVYGGGSTFTLIVPAGDLTGVNIFQNPSDIIANPDENYYSSNSKMLSGLKILMAEDSKDNQELIRIILSKAGATVTIAENGRIAVNKAENESFDVILMDMNMPEMDGCDATRLLRSRGYDRPILALTANAMSDDKESYLAAGCNGHLTKPIDRMNLIQSIAAYVKIIVPKTARALQTVNENNSSQEEAVVSQYIDDPDIVPILEKFVQRLGDQVDDMRSSLANAEFTELRRFAHKMKGSGGNYGYPMLSDAAGDLEDAAKAEDVQSAARALHKVASICDAIKKGFCNYSAAGEYLS